MKTVGELNLNPGDVVKREDGTFGLVVDWDEGRGTSYDLRIWWHHDLEWEGYDDGERVSWEVVPKPVPTVASLGLKFGDVVRCDGTNYLVASVQDLALWLLPADGYSKQLELSAPVPDGFRKVETN